MDNKLSRNQTRYKAKRLYLTGNYTSKEICERIGVTQTTMSRWIKRHGWKTGEAAGYSPKVEIIGLIQPDFAQYLQEHNPRLYHSLCFELREFTGVNRSITTGQAAKIKEIAKTKGLDALNLEGLFTQIAGRPVSKVSMLRKDEAAYIIDHLTKDEKTYELIIKKVNP